MELIRKIEKLVNVTTKIFKESDFDLDKDYIKTQILKPSSPPSFLRRKHRRFISSSINLTTLKNSFSSNGFSKNSYANFRSSSNYAENSKNENSKLDSKRKNIEEEEVKSRDSSWNKKKSLQGEKKR